MFLRADTAYPFEGDAEREGAAVADPPGHRADRGVRLAEQVGGQGQPPAAFDVEPESDEEPEIVEA